MMVVVMKVVVMVKWDELMRQVLDMLEVIVMTAYSDGRDDGGSGGVVVVRYRLCCS